MLTTQVIYPVKPASPRRSEGRKDLADLIGQYGVGNYCYRNTGRPVVKAKPWLQKFLKVSWGFVLSSMKLVFFCLFCQWTSSSGVSDLTVENALLFLLPVAWEDPLLNWSKSILSQSVWSISGRCQSKEIVWKTGLCRRDTVVEAAHEKRPTGTQDRSTVGYCMSG